MRPPLSSISRPSTSTPSHSERPRARTTPSARRRSGVVKTSSVGMLTTQRTPYTVVSLPDFQRDPGQQPDGQVGAGAAEADRVEPALA